MTDLIVQESPSQVARAFQQSGLFPDLQSEAQAFVKIVAGQELGLGPLASVSGLNVIKGRVTFSANLLASLVKNHPAYDYRVTEHSDQLCRIVFTQDREEIGTSEFTVEDAKRAGLGGMNWQKYPKAMLFARALTQGVRWYCPDVTAGAPAYSAEELEEPVQRPRESELLDELAQQVEDYQFDDEQRAALRDFVRDGGEDAIRTALEMLQDGNPSALFAGMTYEAEVVE
jgi:hypothetical protein